MPPVHTMVCSHCGRSTPRASGRCTSCGAPFDGIAVFDGATDSGAPVLAVNPDATGVTAGLPGETGHSAAGTADETRLGNAFGAGTRPDAAAEPIAVGHPFGSRYQIIRQLGIGGMGAVYQAWDQELSVVVALKVIRPEVAADPEAARMLERRFKQELLLARQVTHKNVVRIHDLGEINGVKYITMPYIEGEDLASILKREGKLTVRQVLKMARTMASGLAAAHAAGVVHRDLKPANIMIDADGEAMIMDFGVARSTGAYARSGDVVPRGGMPSIAGGHTLAGMIVGTVEYMAPEQAKAQPVDHRADLYAFGLMLYDLLIGRRRQTSAESALAELTSRTLAAPPSARSIDPDVTEAVDKIITRCVQPDAAARYQTTAELVADLERLDQDGHPLPMVRRLTRRMVVGALAVFLAVLATTWWLARGPAVPVQHDPVSVVIADLQNNTGDSTFDRTLEPMLKRALEDASFISAYDRSGITRTFGVRPTEKLDELAAREVAVKQGLGVVLSGSIDRQGSGYAISMKAAQTVTGDVITNARGRAASKDKVLDAATKLVAKVRRALGDETSDSAQLFAMAAVSATSLEVVRHYAAAREAGANNDFEGARSSLLKAVEIDPKFGIGYQGLAGVSQGLGNLQDAEKYMKEALRYLPGMTERERYTTRGLFDFLTSDYPQCVKEYTEMIAHYPADVTAHNNRALCLSHLRKMPDALNEMKWLVGILPKRLVYRTNLALYAAYAGDFQTAEREARSMQEPDARGVLALAFAQLGQGQLTEASATYSRLGKIDALGASFAASGLGDLATLEGRFSDAVRILEQGAAVDLKAENPDRAAVKLTSLAYAHLLRGQKGAAVAAAKKALANSQAVKIRFLAARSFVEAGNADEAGPLVAALAQALQAEPQAYAKIVEGQIAMNRGDPRQAIKSLTEANLLFDTWIGHFDLGRAYLAFGALPQADSEIDACIKRRGEALSLFLDEEPTYGYFPSVYYYQGRVREELKTEGFADSYRAYLAIRGQSKEDPLLLEVSRRAGS